MRSSIRFALVCLFMGSSVGSAFAQNNTGKDRERSELTAEQKQQALAFANEHHPELAKLVVRLQEKMNDEYEKALGQLYSTSERLERIKDRSQEDYDLQLSLWKVESRIKLHAARMSLSENRKLEQQMKKLLEERAELKLTQLQRERNRLETRMERVEGSIHELENNREAIIDKELERYRRLRPKTKSVSTKSIPQSRTETEPNNTRKKN